MLRLIHLERKKVEDMSKVKRETFQGRVEEEARNR